MDSVPDGVPVDTITICTVAARIGAGRTMVEDLQMAERLLLALALAALALEDGAIGLPDSPRSD